MYDLSPTQDVIASRSSTSSPANSPQIPSPVLQAMELQKGDADVASAYCGSRPDLAYTIGCSFEVTRHVPREPFGRSYTTNCPRAPTGWQLVSQTAICITKPPLAGCSIHGSTKILTITAVLRAGRDCGAQLVVVNNQIVAKIYDPLYYTYFDSYGSQRCVLTDAEGDYSREALAYETLQMSPAARQALPEYHGTWTMNVSTKIEHQGTLYEYVRQVPLILMEVVQGQTMSEVNADLLDPQLRYDILKKALASEAAIFSAGVNHCDFYPRNIMVIGLPHNEAKHVIEPVGVKIIDFNVSAVVIHPQCSNRWGYTNIVIPIQKIWHPKIWSPIVRWGGGGTLMDFELDGWCPRANRVDDDWVAERWLWERFKDDERFIPVVWDPSEPDVEPEHQMVPDVSILHEDVPIDCGVFHLKNQYDVDAFSWDQPTRVLDIFPK
ncbi:hypothetical protein J1614_003313 [Plenodomus biglobosus]|nr:hypothetical protein J1614_003313 [Plenodomus biglobosus]